MKSLKENIIIDDYTYEYVELEEWVQFFSSVFQEIEFGELTHECFFKIGDKIKMMVNFYGETKIPLGVGNLCYDCNSNDSNNQKKTAIGIIDKEMFFNNIVKKYYHFRLKDIDNGPMGIPRFFFITKDQYKIITNKKTNLVDFR